MTKELGCPSGRHRLANTSCGGFSHLQLRSTVDTAYWQHQTTMDSKADVALLLRRIEEISKGSDEKRFKELQMKSALDNDDRGLISWLIPCSPCRRVARGYRQDSSKGSRTFGSRARGRTTPTVH